MAVILNGLEGIEHDIDEDLLHIRILCLNVGHGLPREKADIYPTAGLLPMEDLDAVVQYFIDVDKGIGVLLRHLSKGEHLTDGVINALDLPPQWC